MTFTVDDLQDLLHILDERPEWLSAVRSRVFTEDWLGVPSALSRIADAQARTDEQLVVLTTRVDVLTERIDALTQRMDALTARVDALTGQMQRTNDTLGEMRGDLLELRYRNHANAYFSRLAHRLRVVDDLALANLLDDAVDAGSLDLEDRDQVMLSDLVLTGRRREDAAEVLLVAEISGVIDQHDVERAVVRGRLLAKLGPPVIPIVAGESIGLAAATLAGETGVWAYLGGRATAPDAPFITSA